MKDSQKSKSNHSERAHSTVGASNSKRWLNCAGSVAAEAASPEQEDNEHSLRGTKLHEDTERVLKHWQKTGKWKFKDAEEADLLAPLKNHLEATLKERNFDPKTEMLIEEKIDLAEVVHPLCFGTNDLGITQLFQTLEVIDYKFGKFLVSPIDNTQLIYYALGMAYKFDNNFDRVKLTVFQPANENNPIQSWEIPMDKLEGYGPLFRKGVERTQKKDAKRFAGEWCHYCRAASTCETLKEASLKKVTEDFDFDVEESKDLVVVEKGLTVDKVSSYLDACDKLEVWIDAIRARAREMLQNGKKIPGWMMTPTNGKRIWKSEKGAAKAAANMKIKFYTEYGLTPPELEKKIGKKKFQERFEVFTTKSEGKSERLTRVRDVSKDFNDLESEW